MMKKNLSKLVALAIAGAMVITPLPVSAAEVDSEDAAQGTTTGTGDVEGIVNKDVFKVELPTIAAGDTTFNFILDPQGLIKDTNGAAHSGATFDENAKGLYFANPQADSSVKYMASSPALTAKNKGTVDVDVTLSATANALSDTGYSIGLAPDDTFAGDKATNVYLALVSGTQTVALTDEGATITDTLDAAPADAYEVTYDTTDSKYKYGLTAAAQAADYAGFDSLDFNMTGACNTAADWAAAEAAAPTVDVAWKLEKHAESPVFTTGSAVGSINYTKGAGKTALASITSITMLRNGTAYNGYSASSFGWAAAKDTGSTITFDSVYTGFWAGDGVSSTEATVTYTDVSGDSHTATVTVNTLAVSPTFTTGSEVGTINYNAGSGPNALASITSITMMRSGTTYDGYSASSFGWAAAKDTGTTITFDSVYTNFWGVTDNVPSAEATITYTDVSGNTQTATVTVKTQ